MKALALDMIDTMMRMELEYDPQRYLDDTLAVREVVGVLGTYLPGPTTQVVVERHLGNKARQSHLVAIPQEVFEAEAVATAREAEERKALAVRCNAERKAIATEILQRVRSRQPRDWGWQYWSAPRSLRRWAEQAITEKFATPEEAGWHRVWIYLTLREAALAELEQQELSADLRVEIYLRGQIGAPAEIDHREGDDGTRPGGGTNFVRGKGVTKDDGRVERKVNKKRAPKRRESEIEKARKRLATATTAEAREAAQKALDRLTFNPRPAFRKAKDGTYVAPNGFDDDGIALPKAYAAAPRPTGTGLTAAQWRTQQINQAVALLRPPKVLNRPYLYRLVTFPRVTTTLRLVRALRALRAA